MICHLVVHVVVTRAHGQCQPQSNIPGVLEIDGCCADVLILIGSQASQHALLIGIAPAVIALRVKIKAQHKLVFSSLRITTRFRCPTVMAPEPPDFPVKIHAAALPIAVDIKRQTIIEIPQYVVGPEHQRLILIDVLAPGQAHCLLIKGFAGIEQQIARSCLATVLDDLAGIQAARVLRPGRIRRVEYQGKPGVVTKLVAEFAVQQITAIFGMIPVTIEPGRGHIGQPVPGTLITARLGLELPITVGAQVYPAGNEWGIRAIFRTDVDHAPGSCTKDGRKWSSDDLYLLGGTQIDCINTRLAVRQGKRNIIGKNADATDTKIGLSTETPYRDAQVLGEVVAVLKEQAGDRGEGFIQTQLLTGCLNLLEAYETGRKWKFIDVRGNPGSRNCDFLKNFRKHIGTGLIRPAECPGRMQDKKRQTYYNPQTCAPHSLTPRHLPSRAQNLLQLGFEVID